MTGQAKTYRAFISYSQQDKVWGKRLHGWLESYRIPAGTTSALPAGERLGRFFRDDEEMAAASDIAQIVERSIDDSESMIVLCSPRSAQSEWVAAEIEQFRRGGAPRRVFAFIIDGIPNSGDPDTECFPAAFRRAHHPGDPRALPIEPLGLDVRKDGRDRAVARLAAGLLGVDFDDLWQRDRRRQELAQRKLLVGLAALSSVFALLAATAIVLGFQARQNARSAHDNLAAFFAERAWQRLGSQDVQAAARYALSGMDLSERNANSYHAVLSAVMFEAGESLPPLLHGGDVFSARFSPDGKRVVTTSEDGTAKVWDATTGALIALLIGHQGRVSAADFSGDGASLVTASHDATAIVWDMTTFVARVQLKGHQQPLQTARFSDDGNKVLTSSRDGTARLWDAVSGDVRQQFGEPGEPAWAAEFSPDQAHVLTSHEDGNARIWDIGTGRLVRTLSGH
ncbi:MAG: TIR domain-containing protein, partial [Hyphomonas sp.]|uniref:toll/interleukin-1 receptor domain-containing protein n=1 Tax=Hyphomonas sp. TaxID=87 RepID=UPI0034A0A426